MKINAINPSEKKESDWYYEWGGRNDDGRKDDICDRNFGRGWRFDRGDYGYKCAGRCGSALWVYCQRNYENSSWGDVPDNVVRIYTGLEGTKKYNKIHYKDFGIGEYSYIGDDLNDASVSIAVPKGLVAILYEHNNFEGKSVTINGNSDYNEYNAASGGAFRNLFRDGIESGVSSLKIKKDCGGDLYYFDPDCNAEGNVESSPTFGKRRTFCNASIDNAYSDKCIEWCKSNSTSCTVLNQKQDCVKYGYCMDDNPKLCSDACTSEAMAKLQGQCKKYGLDSEQGMRLYGCTKNGIKTFIDECEEYKVAEEICTAIELQNAKTNKFNADQLALAQQSQQQSQQNYQQTQSTILNVLGMSGPIDSSESSTAFPTSVDELIPLLQDNMTVLAVAAIGIIVLSSCSSSLLLLKK